MANEKEPERPQDKWRRFRVARKVKEQPVEPREQRELREAEEDDALRGTPEQDRAVRQGCNGCLKVTALFFLIMIASIFTTCYIRTE